MPTNTRKFSFMDTAGKPGTFEASTAPGEGGGYVVSQAEAERLLREHGDALPFDVRARNYGEDDGYFTGLYPEDLDRQEPIGQQLAADCGPFEVWGHTMDCAELVPAAGACPHCGSADLLAVEEDMSAPVPEIDAEGEERTELRCPACGKKVVVVRRLVLDRIEKGE